jgi:hypothetical protein
MVVAVMHPEPDLESQEWPVLAVVEVLVEQVLVTLIQAPAVQV